MYSKFKVNDKLINFIFLLFLFLNTKLTFTNQKILISKSEKRFVQENTDFDAVLGLNHHSGNKDEPLRHYNLSKLGNYSNSSQIQGNSTEDSFFKVELCKQAVSISEMLQELEITFAQMTNRFNEEERMHKANQIVAVNAHKANEIQIKRLHSKAKFLNEANQILKRISKLKEILSNIKVENKCKLLFSAYSQLNNAIAHVEQITLTNEKTNLLKKKTSTTN